MPTGSPTYFKGVIKLEDVRYFMYVRANVIIPQMDVGVLPIKHNNTIIYPTGEISGVFTNEELINAKKNSAKARDSARVPACMCVNRETDR